MRGHMLYMQLESRVLQYNEIAYIYPPIKVLTIPTEAEGAFSLYIHKQKQASHIKENNNFRTGNTTKTSSFTYDSAGDCR
jgi:hypothetical protein